MCIRDRDISSDNIVEAIFHGEDTWSCVARFAEEILLARKIDLDNTVAKNNKSDVSQRAKE